ncbi:MAG: DegT/DnrJ/EryC1/StrS family aminotransferase [Acidobacteriota bacterium]
METRRPLTMADDFLPVSAPLIEEDDVAAVVDCLRSGWITTGERAAALEAELSRRCEGRTVVALSSCTAALQLSMVLAGIGEGDEVVTSPLSFVAAVNVLVQAGATPVLADVEPDTLNLSVESVASRITPRTRAVLPVHHGGLPCDLPALSALAAEHELVVIEDAAHALGASSGGRPVGAWSPFTAFSFHALKNATSAEGGALVLEDASLEERARRLSLHGLSRAAWRRKSGMQWRYEVEEPGFKANLSDLQAALGLSQLRKLDAWNDRRRELSTRYREGLAEHPWLRPLALRDGRVSSAHLFVVRLSDDAPCTRDELAESLHEQGIGTSVHFQPVHRFTAHRERFAGVELPSCESAADRILSLPLHPGMRDADVERVVAALAT